MFKWLCVKMLQKKKRKNRETNSEVSRRTLYTATQPSAAGKHEYSPSVLNHAHYFTRTPQDANNDTTNSYENYFCPKGSFSLCPPNP